MYNVLIVDDDKYVLSILGEQLTIYGDLFTPIYARDGQEALDILEREEIALVVTDLMMPGEVNGWNLIERIEKDHDNVPCVVMTGCAERDKLKLVEKKVRHIFCKPFKLEQLVEVITNILNEDLTGGNLEGISVGSFLQLLQIEGKTCLLEIYTAQNERGLLYIDKGILFDAVYGDLHDQKAACQLIALENPHLKIRALPKKKIRRRINTDLMALIMEAMRLKDEQQEESDTLPIMNHVVDHAGSEENSAAPDVPEPDAPAGLAMQDINGEQDDQPTGESLPKNKKENNIMVLEEKLATLRTINGYKASAVMNFTGEVLAADSIDQNVDLATVGAVFNDIFRTSHEAAGKVGLDVCNEMTLKTPNGLVIMSCSGVDAPVHFHLIAVLDKDGNQALAKMQLDKLTPGFMDELS